MIIRLTEVVKGDSLRFTEGQKMTDQIYQQLHHLEDRIIQVNGLMKALQKIACDNDAEVCVMRSLNETLDTMTADFYDLWRCIYPEKPAK